jgi:hypothetical protein
VFVGVLDSSQRRFEGELGDEQEWDNDAQRRQVYCFGIRNKQPCH